MSITICSVLIAAAFCSTAIAGDAVWVSSLEIGKAVQGYGHPRANAACNGGPISIRGRQFAHGFATHAVIHRAYVTTKLRGLAGLLLKILSRFLAVDTRSARF